MTAEEKERGHSRWWARPLGCLGVLGVGLCGAVIGGAISGATCDPNEDIGCFDAGYRALWVGFLIGLFAGLLLWRWLAGRSSRDRR